MLPKVAHEENDKSCLNSIFTLLFNYLQPVLFIFDLPLILRVVHIRKKIEISIFSIIDSMIFIKCCGFIVLSNLTNMTVSAIFGKNLLN